jgi:hypothetical protein
MLELLAAILSEFAFSAGPCRAELLNYLSLLTLALAFGKVAFRTSARLLRRPGGLTEAVHVSIK